jgi:hypothetical protein
MPLTFLTYLGVDEKDRIIVLVAVVSFQIILPFYIFQVVHSTIQFHYILLYCSHLKAEVGDLTCKVGHSYI